MVMKEARFEGLSRERSVLGMIFGFYFAIN
jgi:hypothetical protein